ncbi:hypothetical protein RCL_jg11207.t1 [Rhizophagus clarus]|uniref:Uncharacterized protein n=1 Tax=Rhizophagus clarus TaxID=94130 RepID=A0A8H3M6M9_9GLOM|nr:hypothetical protein RCL_jg11207.t1 [Rhizophagus clarus]
MRFLRTDKLLPCPKPFSCDNAHEPTKIKDQAQVGTRFLKTLPASRNANNRKFRRNEYRRLRQWNRIMELDSVY